MVGSKPDKILTSPEPKSLLSSTQILALLDPNPSSLQPKSLLSSDQILAKKIENVQKNIFFLRIMQGLP